MNIQEALKTIQGATQTAHQMVNDMKDKLSPDQLKEFEAIHEKTKSLINNYDNFESAQDVADFMNQLNINK